MQQSWQQWNRKARAFMWVLTLVGVLAALPLGATRWQMEDSSSKNVDFVFDYRDLVQAASYTAHPRQYIADELVKMKDAGITSMAIFESSLEELVWADYLSVYNSAAAAELQDQPVAPDENYTYLLFAGEEEEAALSPMIEQTFANWEIAVKPWSFGGRTGLILETPVENAMLKPMNPDPIALQAIHAAGFSIVPRLSDRIPYDQNMVDAQMAELSKLGVNRLLFEGDAVKGYKDNAEKKSIAGFAHILTKYNIGIAAIENSKAQKGMNSLAYLTQYNIARLYSLSDSDAATMEPEAIADRFHLAVKDRNIRMFYLNTAPTRSAAKSAVVNSLPNIYDALQGEQGAIRKLSDLGYEAGPAQPFDYESPSWHKPLKAVVALGAVALITLLVSAFIPGVVIPVFLIGLIGSAGLYVLSKPTLEQGLALGAAISAPTLAIIWAISRVKAHTTGSLRPVGGAGTAKSGFGGLNWVFPGLSFGRRITMALSIFAMTSVISLIGVPYVFGLLNNITYSLVLEQFRGVSLLHLAPIGLSALYVFLFTSGSFGGNIRRILNAQITVLWVVVAGVLGIVGMYYLSRTGNAGQASALELFTRNVLETTFGVRPRFKEFMLSHPLFLVGLFLALRYRAAWVFFIVGSIGQLSMVDTFAHIHTPLHISLIRVVLGLVLGAIIGLVGIGVWQVLEGVWRKWVLRYVPMLKISQK
ncbi:DUF5693 family protein [Paenibacillus methanolicus]|uniref:Uncharacterized protein n=1 Tax=Paenibacillus methanolicus TaxID=582686 RepID=A0A5S5CAP7_9BACL|nr:DUF5693 family protein [Paenibacillus methanolicus]TYP75698.1 hypothetical protein BCM02_104379 [Paenibacillus methanolicus]